MNRSMLIRRLLSARRAQTVTLLVVGFSLAAGMTGLLTVRASTAQAVADTIRVDHAGHRFTVGVLDDTVTPALAARGDLLPIWEDLGTVATPAGQVPATVRAVAGVEAASGVLVDGERPRRAGEATASVAVLRALHAGVGDTLTVSEAGKTTSVRVTGVTVSPADRDDASVLLFAPGDPATAALWVTDTDVFADAQLRPMLDARQLKGRTVGILAEEQEADAINLLLAALRYSAPAFALLAVCLAGIVLAALHRERRRDVLALAVAGMPVGAGWRLVATAAAWCLVAGSVLGAATTLAVCFLLRTPISGLLNQQWQSITVSWLGLIGYLLLFAPAALVLARVTTRDATPSAVLDRLRPAWTGAALSGVGVAVLALMATRVLPVALAALAGLCTVIGATLLLATVLTATRRPALRRLVRHSARPMAGLALAAAVITFSTGYYAARSDHSAQAIVADNALPQPFGSLYVYGINAETSRSLRQQYTMLGGRQAVSYLIPAEASRQLRVTNPRMVDCLHQRGTTDPDAVLGECGPQDTTSPINTVALTDDPATAGLRADRALVEGGRAGLLTFPAETSSVSASVTEPAQEDPVLGGNLPGAVVGVDSALAKRLGLVPSGGQSLALVDFGSLSEADRAGMRNAVVRAASTAEFIEFRNDDEAQFRAIATATAIGATAVVVLVLTAVGMSFLASQRDLRRMLGHLGVNRRRRRAVGARMLVLPVAAQLVALAAAWASAWLAGVHNGSGFGWLWSVPGAGGVLVCVVLAIAYGSSAQSAADRT